MNDRIFLNIKNLSFRERGCHSLSWLGPLALCPCLSTGLPLSLKSYSTLINFVYITYILKYFLFIQKTYKFFYWKSGREKKIFVNTQYTVLLFWNDTIYGEKFIKNLMVILCLKISKRVVKSDKINKLKFCFLLKIYTNTLLNVFI